jgi:hypothetical protein
LPFEQLHVAISTLYGKAMGDMDDFDDLNDNGAAGRAFLCVRRAEERRAM